MCLITLKRILSAFAILLLSSGLIFGAIGIVTSVSAQMMGSPTSNTSNLKASLSNEGSNAIDTFTSSGKISSLVFVHEKPTKDNNSSEIKVLSVNNRSDIAGQTVNATKFVLSGNWELKVDKGKVANFTAKFIKVLADGNRWHTHEITNFNSNNTRIELKPDNTLSISGTVDVKLNNTIPWNGTNANVMISKGKTITIVLDNNATGDHFQGQPIYGIVDSIKDASGKEMLSEQHQIITKLEQ
jgi:hypothetical protein